MAIRTWIADAVRGALGRVPGRGPTILLYHRIGNDEFDPWSMTVSRENFSDQMEWLTGHRTVMPLAAFAEAHRNRVLPADAVAITFDDGYACNAHVAAPILERMGLSATIFVSAGPIERGGLFWWDELQHLVIDGRNDQVTLSGEGLELGAKREEDTRWSASSPPRTARQKAFLAIWSRLQRASAEQRDVLMDELRSQSETSKPADLLKRPMTMGELHAVNSIVEFGSHAVTHSSLPSLSSSGKAHEIRDSRNRVQAITGARPTTFAYPFGDADKECERLVEEAGFACACVTGERPVGPGAALFALPRKGVGNFGADGLATLLGES